MKFLISLIFLASFQTFAADPVDSSTPGPKPTTPSQEKVEDLKQTGGALKVQKKPAKIKGLNAPKDDKKDKSKEEKNRN
jgi:hypothetical protein